MVPPSTFIPLAENVGSIVALGEWVMRNACATAATWPKHLTVAVNLSPVQLRSPALGQIVVGALNASGLAPGRLELEITETVLLGDNETTLSVLSRLRDLGVRIAMDDFGTGYSSLSYLQNFHVDKIKIDRSFVTGVANDAGFAQHRAGGHGHGQGPRHDDDRGGRGNGRAAGDRPARRAAPRCRASSSASRCTADEIEALLSDGCGLMQRRVRRRRHKACRRRSSLSRLMCSHRRTTSERQRP